MSSPHCPLRCCGTATDVSVSRQHAATALSLPRSVPEKVIEARMRLCSTTYLYVDMDHPRGSKPFIGPQPQPRIGLMLRIGPATCWSSSNETSRSVCLRAY